MASRGRISAVSAVVASVLAGTALAAFACTNLATLGTAETTGRAGAVVPVTGSSFAAAEEGAAPSPVAIRWNKVDGPVLTEVLPDARGGISGTITVPEAAPGHYVIVATQVNDEGEAQFGTPARAPFQVVGADGQALPPPAAPVAATSADSGSTDSAALVVALGAVSIGVFAAGLVALRQERRRVAVPAPQRVRRG